MKYQVAVFAVPESAEFNHTLTLKYKVKVPSLNGEELVNATQQTELHEFVDKEKLCEFVEEDVDKRITRG